MFSEGVLVDRTALGKFGGRELGFASDLRDYGMGAQILCDLGVRRIRLLTNNPQKVATLQELGVEVTERVAHQLPANPHNQRYLDTKRDRTGHKL